MKKTKILLTLCVIFACTSANVLAARNIRHIDDVKESGFRYIIESLDENKGQVNDNTPKKFNIYGMIQEHACINKEACPNIYGNYWATEDWSNCANSVQTRSVNCFDTIIKTNTVDSECDINKKPAASQSCVVKNFLWLPDQWGACNACGTGAKSRTLSCHDELLNKVDSSLCSTPSTIPTSSQCVSTSACEYHWSVGEWSACINGEKTRPVICLDESKNIVSEELCIAPEWYYVPPSVELGCDAPYDPGYSWRYGDWSACIYSQYRAYPYQERSTTCVNSSGTPVNSNYCNYGGARTSETERSGCVEWSLSEWSECTGDKIQTRTLQCMDAYKDVPRDDVYCEGMTKPSMSLTQDCSIEVNAWHTGNWSCSECTGIPTREVSCRNVFTNEAVSDALCSAEKPIDSDPDSDEAECNECNYQWTTSSWSDCVANGGSLKETRDVTCKDSSYGTTVADSVCLGIYGDGSKAAPERVCYAFWSYGGWTECPNTGSFTQRTQTPYCFDQDHVLVSESACLITDGPKPEIGYQQCNYYWGAPAWGDCTASCGVTTEETREAYCYRMDGMMAILGQEPSLCEAKTGYKAEDNYNLVKRLCVGSCDGGWAVTSVAGCSFDNHFSSGGSMNISYGCENYSTGEISTDENNMRCSLATKPSADKIGCYYNISDPSGMSEINGQIQAGVQDPAQFSNGQIVPGSPLETVMYNLNGYMP